MIRKSAIFNFVGHQIFIKRRKIFKKLISLKYLKKIKKLYDVKFLNVLMFVYN
jgi:hypothetical protein